MEQIFFLVLVAVVGLARWFLQAAENKKNAEAERRSGEPSSDTPPARAPAQSEEERVRRFFEALGVPPSSSPPPKVQPRQVTPRKPRAKGTISPIDPFPMPRTGGLPPPLVASIPTAAREAPPVPKGPGSIVQERIPATTRMEPAAANFEVHDIDEGWLAESIPGEISKSSLQGIGSRLVTTEGLRDAIVLREIFGPPRSMQPFSHGTLG